MGRTLTDNEAMRTYRAVRFVEGQPGYQLPPRENKRLALAEGDGNGNGPNTTSPCGCDFVSAGSVDCLGTGDSANVYVVDDLGPLGTNVELTFDASCEWISPDIDYDCSGS